MAASEVIRSTITCGVPARATRFSYSGSLQSGIVIHLKTASARINPAFLHTLIAEFRGRKIPGGFNMDNPTRGGLGIWVRDNSRILNGEPLSPRHASFIAAILRDAGHLTSITEGNTVILQFAP